MGKVVGIVLFACALGGTVLFTVGFATPSWTTAGSVRKGLWQICYENACFRITDMITDIPAWFTAVQVIETFGLLCLLITLMLAAVVALGLPVKKDLAVKALVTLCMMSTSLISTGVAIFAINTTHSLHYSFSLVVVGAILCLFVAILACTHQKTRNELK